MFASIQVQSLSTDKSVPVFLVSDVSAFPLPSAQMVFHQPALDSDALVAGAFTGHLFLENTIGVWGMADHFNMERESGVLGDRRLRSPIPLFLDFLQSKKKDRRDF